MKELRKMTLEELKEELQGLKDQKHEKYVSWYSKCARIELLISEKEDENKN